MSQEEKNIKLFLGRSDLIGDTVMCEPILRYAEKIYPNSYKIWHILGKCSSGAPFWLNHPLIDRIKISSNLESYDNEDYQLMKESHVVINTRPQHSDPYWYNTYNCVEETIRMAGINLEHFKQILTEEERRPKLYRYFPIGLFNESHAGYCKSELNQTPNSGIIAIKPFCGYGKGINRSPSKEWWVNMVSCLLEEGYEVYHFGFINEPILSYNTKYRYLVNLSLFDQIKGALGCKLTIGNDCGFMWINGAYSHPAIHLITQWLPNHTQNPLALAPVNINGTNIFYQNNEYPKYEDILKLANE